MIEISSGQLIPISLSPLIRPIAILSDEQTIDETSVFLKKDAAL